MSQPPRDEAGLAQPGRRERRLGLALEPLFDDERGFAVADQDERRVQAGRDERRLCGGQRVLPRRIVQRSRTAS